MEKEIVDIYDEYMHWIGCEDREVVHKKGLWHKTVHCWLCDKSGYVYFQIRKNSQKLYTTASGHVQEGESVKQAFRREVCEEIGYKVNLDDCMLIEINAWRMDKIKNGEPFIDRAFANVYLNMIDEDFDNFKFCVDEVSGLVKVKAIDVLDLFLNKVNNIQGVRIGDKKENVQISQEDFLVIDGELPIIKYGKILQRIIEYTQAG